MSISLEKFEQRRERKLKASLAEAHRIKSVPPIIRSFKLLGVNNFKDIGIDFEAPVKVVAAENGVGKTTLMNALYSILAGKAEILSRIDFKSFAIVFHNREPLFYEKKDLFPQGNIEAAIEASKFDSFIMPNWSITNADVQDLLLAHVAGTLDDHPLYEQMYLDSPYDHDDIQRAFERLTQAYDFKHNEWLDLQNEVKSALGEVDIVYLPTYRRVEADLPEYRKRQVRSRGRRRSGRMIGERKDNLINFGLADVEEKIGDLLREIKESTLSAYSQISRNTLQQLATKQPKADKAEVNFEQDDIKVIFARLPEDNSVAESAVLALIENGSINRAENRNLRNFLSQLVDAFNETRDRESTINKFVEIVNDYFSYGVKEKEIIYDKFNMRVAIRNIINQDFLALNNLSSGEKQIVSIFSRLCLDQTRKVIVLIDEPELSLSMDWQKWLLPDLWMTGNCAQIVAITHSPFVFENAFDRFAGSMALSYTQRAPK